MMRRDVGLVEVLGLAAPGRIAAAAAVAAALEAGEAAAAARKTAAGTANDAPYHRDENQPADDDDGDNRPPGRTEVSITNSAAEEGGETYLQKVACMQLSQLEKAVLTSVIWP